MTSIGKWVILVICLIIIQFYVWMLALNPEYVGQWEAQRDIAYDSIWSEYLADCDCAEFLE